MKILYIGGFQLPDKNAAAQRVVNIAKALRDFGQDVVFLHNVKSIKFPVWKNYFGFRSYECGKNPIKYNFGISIIKKIAKDEKIDTIIAYNYPSIALNKLVSFCKKQKIKVVADVTEWYEVQGKSIKSLIKRWDVKFRMTKVHPKMDGIIAISQYLYDYYKNKTNTVKIPPLVDLSEAKWRTEKEKNNVPTFVYAGDPSTQKERLDLIVNMIEEIAKEKSIALKVVGITREEYEFMYSTSYGGNSIKFYGRLPHKDAVREVALADWSIIIREDTLSNKAGFPTKVVESISCGTPVIANYFSNIKDYLDERNSLLVNNIDDILDNIVFAMQKKDNLVDNTTFNYTKYINNLKIFMDYNK